MNTKNELTIDEIKKYSLLILKEVKRICENNNLTYFLDSGTLLGAIRHNGFIPWDDDIDIAMPRPDYEKLIIIFNEETEKPYFLHSFNTDKKYFFSFAKVCDKRTLKIEHGINLKQGLSIDIFPIDGYPDNENNIKKHWEKLLFNFHEYVQHLNHSNSLNKKTLFTRIKLSKSLKLTRNKAIEVDTYAKSYNYELSKQAGINTIIYYGKNCRNFNKSIWTPIEHIFEDDSFSIPQGYDFILKNYYGNYMELPPEEKRTSSHGSVIYWK